MATGERVSHDAYAEHCRQVAIADPSTAAVLHVQVQKRGATLCGQVCDMARFQDAREAEWFKVRTQLGTGWFPSRNLRLCSQLDGRCSCEAQLACGDDGETF